MLLSPMTDAKKAAHHGTHHASLPLHAGLCLAVGDDDGYRAASAYARRAGGEFVFEVSIDMADMTVVEVDIDPAELLRTGDDYPGDSAAARAEYLASGVDILAYDDEVLGIPHRTLRLLSDRALAAVSVTGEFDPAA